jgi:hypothetical protein
MLQLENHFTHFQEIWYWKVLLNFSKTLHSWLQSANNNKHFTHSLNIHQNILQIEITYFMPNVLFP